MVEEGVEFILRAIGLKPELELELPCTPPASLEWGALCTEQWATVSSHHLWMEHVRSADYNAQHINKGAVGVHVQA